MAKIVPSGDIKPRPLARTKPGVAACATLNKHKSKTRRQEGIRKRSTSFLKKRSKKLLNVARSCSGSLDGFAITQNGQKHFGFFSKNELLLQAAAD
jgi:hypothetical protein